MGLVDDSFWAKLVPPTTVVAITVNTTLILAL